MEGDVKKVSLALYVAAGVVAVGALSPAENLISLALFGIAVSLTMWRK